MLVNNGAKSKMYGYFDLDFRLPLAVMVGGSFCLLIFGIWLRGWKKFEGLFIWCFCGVGK